MEVAALAVIALGGAIGAAAADAAGILGRWSSSSTSTSSNSSSPTVAAEAQDDDMFSGDDDEEKGSPLQQQMEAAAVAPECLESTAGESVKESLSIDEQQKEKSHQELALHQDVMRQDGHGTDSADMVVDLRAATATDRSSTPGMDKLSETGGATEDVSSRNEQPELVKDTANTIEKEKSAYRLLLRRLLARVTGAQQQHRRLQQEQKMQQHQQQQKQNEEDDEEATLPDEAWEQADLSNILKDLPPEAALHAALSINSRTTNSPNSNVSADSVSSREDDLYSGGGLPNNNSSSEASAVQNHVDDGAVAADSHTILPLWRACTTRLMHTLTGKGRRLARKNAAGPAFEEISRTAPAKEDAEAAIDTTAEDATAIIVEELAAAGGTERAEAARLDTAAEMNEAAEWKQMQSGIECVSTLQAVRDLESGIEGSVMIAFPVAEEKLEAVEDARGGAAAEISNENRSRSLSTSIAETGSSRDETQKPHQADQIREEKRVAQKSPFKERQAENQVPPRKRRRRREHHEQKQQQWKKHQQQNSDTMQRQMQREEDSMQQLLQEDYNLQQEPQQHGDGIHEQQQDVERQLDDIAYGEEEQHQPHDELQEKQIEQQQEPQWGVAGLSPNGEETYVFRTEERDAEAGALQSTAALSSSITVDSWPENYEQQFEQAQQQVVVQEGSALQGNDTETDFVTDERSVARVQDFPSGALFASNATSVHSAALGGELQGVINGAAAEAAGEGSTFLYSMCPEANEEERRNPAEQAARHAAAHVDAERQQQQQLLLLSPASRSSRYLAEEVTAETAAA